MKTAALIPVEEYLRTTYDPDCDYVDGEVQERNLGELDHSDLQTEFVQLARTGHAYEPGHGALKERVLKRFRKYEGLLLPR